MANSQFSDLPTLTISFTPKGPKTATVAMQFDLPGNPAGFPLESSVFRLDFTKLREAALDPDAYGQELSEILFSSPALQKYFEKSWVLAQDRSLGLRMVFRISPSLPKLFDLRWETLCRYGSREHLITNANYPFSRFLGEENWSQIELEPKGSLRILVAVANPADLKKGIQLINQSMGEVDVPGELSRARTALQSVGPVTELASADSGPWQVTLEELGKRLRQGFDILYLVCHGALLPDKPDDPDSANSPYLLLELPDGRHDLVPAESLFRIVNELEIRFRPRLAVLAACQSGGQGKVPDSGETSSGDRGALAALGPRLARAGIAAVVAMQDNITMKTVETFMPVFFEELAKTGQIERAMAVARSSAITVQRQDWWVPVLYTRLQDGDLFSKITPTADPLKSYLVCASQKPRFDLDMNPDLETLWDQVPYRASVIGQTAEEALPLSELIDRLFPSEASGRYHRAVLLGSAGQGKTSALRDLLSKFARDAITQLNVGVGEPKPAHLTIPLFFSLNDLRQRVSMDRQILKAVNERLESCGAPAIQKEQLNEWATHHRILFLIDDLEALITWRHGIGLEMLTDFINEPPYQNQIYLIACRSSSYQYQLGTVNLLEIANLEIEDVLKVLDQERFNQLSPQLKKLAENRSMLRLILDVQDAKFQTKGQLMKLWVEHRLGLEGERVDGMDSFLLKTVLEQLAFEMRSAHSLVRDENRVIELVSALLLARQEKYHWRDVLENLRNIGALEIDPARRCYSFVERSFADYFSAAAVDSDPDRRQLVLDTASDYWWRDMLEILIGLEEDPAELLYQLIDRDAIVAALCIQAAAIEPDSPVYSALSDGLVEQMQRVSSAHRKQIVDRIVESEHPRVPEVLLRSLHREWSSLVIMAIAKGLEQWKQKLARMDDLVDTEASVLASFPQDLNSYKSWLKIKTPICQEKDGCEQGSIYPEELKVLEKIMHQRTNPAKLRGLAAISLGLSHYRQAGFELLKLVESPKIDDLLAWCAVEALAEFPDLKVRQQAFNIAQEYGSRQFMSKPPRYRARFIYLLGWLSEEGCAFQPGLSSESPSQVILMKALEDQHAIVRGFAIEAMVRLNLKDTRLVVESLLGSGNLQGTESEPLVLRKAAEALGQIGTLDSIKVLENIMKADVAQTNQSVRSAYRYAIQEIQKRYGV